MCMSVFPECVSVLTERMLVPLDFLEPELQVLLGNEPMSSGRAAVLKTAEPLIAHALSECC